MKHVQAALLEPHNANIKQLAGEFSGEASIPLTSLGVPDQSNRTSADSYLRPREDLIAEAEGSLDDWTLPLRRYIARGLAIQHATEVDPRWSTFETKWRDPDYLSRARSGRRWRQAVGVGAPWLADTEVGLELLGLDAQRICRALAEKRRAAGRQVLATLATEAL